MKAEVYLHSLVILQARTSSLELTVPQGAVNDGPERMDALVVQWLQKLPCKHRTELRGQLSSAMKCMWLLLCLQAACSGHPTDSSICAGKTHQPGCAYEPAHPISSQQVRARWFGSRACSFQPCDPMFPLRSWALCRQGSLETACPLSRWWLLFGKD